MLDGSGQVAIGRKGAQFALQRLEIEEAQLHARLQQALASRNQFEIEQAQMFWVRCVESLRKLDLSVELGRRYLEEMVPKRLACDIALYISDWLRISFMIFLSSESRTLMGIKDTGQWKAHAIAAFKGILDLTVKNSLKTNSPIPPWAAKEVMESWNVR
jgi:hypothetical protein